MCILRTESGSVSAYMCVCVRALVHVHPHLFKFIDDDGEKPQSMNLAITEDQIT